MDVAWASFWEIVSARNLVLLECLVLLCVVREQQSLNLTFLVEVMLDNKAPGPG